MDVEHLLAVDSYRQPIALLGSTGSIGEQTLSVCEALQIPVYALTCARSLDRIWKQICRFHPAVVCVADPEIAQALADRFRDSDAHFAFQKEALPQAYSDHFPEILIGEEGACSIVQRPQVQRVVAAMVGFSGLKPVVSAIQAKKTIALANKEILVTAGEQVLTLAQEQGVEILPIDSEHSAIWQCLRGGERGDLKRILLTASGGPFRQHPRDSLSKLTAREALAHPTWSMGAKITVDSATLMNKGLEVIEAARLFGVRGDQIQVVIHPQSVIHSMIEWKNGSVIAQLGYPDMRLPIQEALTYPMMAEATTPTWDPFADRCQTLTFEPPRFQDFPLLELAYTALDEGGFAPTILNAVNEVGVAAFLRGEIQYGQLVRVVQEGFTNCSRLLYKPEAWLDGIIEQDTAARGVAKELLKCL